MSVTLQALPAGQRLTTVAIRRRARRGRRYGSDRVWAIAFALPYVVIFFAFVLYPVVYGLWMGSDPALYRQLFDDPRYLTAVINTLLYVGIGVNLKMALAFLLLGVGATVWVRHVMPKVEIAEDRHPLRSSDEARKQFAETFKEGAEASAFVKRPLIRRTLIAATVPVALAPIVLLRDLGPLPYDSLDHTVWRKGMRLIVYGTNRPITPAEFNTPGSMITVAPDGFQSDFDAMAKAAVIIIKMAPGQLQPPTVMNWTVNDIVAYSKICTHVGCPAALYEQTTHHILCPCHQSTFDATAGAKVLFGPATRPLPQLPITTDAQGFLVAQSDFHEAVGPSFWERS